MCRCSGWPVAILITLSLLIPIPAYSGPQVAGAPVPLESIGGWRSGINASWLEEYGVSVLDAGFTEAERLGGALYLGGYAVTLLYYGGNYLWYTDAVVFPYSFAEEYNKYTEQFIWIGMDAMSSYAITYDTVTDLLAVDTVNATGNVSLYFTVTGLDYASYVEGYPIFYSGVYMYPADYDGVLQGSGTGDTYSVGDARSLFGDDNVLGIAFTSLHYTWSPSPRLYVAGFATYNESGSVFEYPVVLVYSNPFNLTSGPSAARLYRLPYYYRRAWRPYEILLVNGTLYMVGLLYAKTGDLSLYYPEGLFVIAVNASTLDYVDAALLPVRDDLTLGATSIALFTRPYTRYWGTPSTIYDLGDEGGFGEGGTIPAYLDKIGVAALGDRLVIASYGYENDTGDYIGLVYLVDTRNWSAPSSWSLTSLLTLGTAAAETTVDYASAAQVYETNEGGRYILVTGAINYTVNTDLSRVNGFYLVLDTEIEPVYMFLEGGNATDMIYDVGEVSIATDAGVFVRPYYSALISSSPSMYVYNATGLYTGGALRPTARAVVGYSGPVEEIHGRRGVHGGTYVTDKKKLVGETGGVGIKQSPYGGVWAYLLQPGLPPSTLMYISYEPSTPVAWSETPGYVLINITVTLIDNYTGEPVAGEPVRLFVSPPNTTYYSLYGTAYTDTYGRAFFQYNATMPGAYFFEAAYFGTALHGRAFQVFRIDLPNYRVVLSLSIPSNTTYTLYEEEPLLVANLTLLNLSGSGEPFTLSGQLVALELYIDSFVASKTGLAEGTWYPISYRYTNSSGIAVFTIPKGLFYYYYAHNYTFRAHYYGNDTIGSPENTSSTAILDVEPTPTMISVAPPAPSGSRNVSDTDIIVARLVWSHDGFATENPVIGGEVRLYYLPENQTGIVYTAETNGTGHAVFSLTYTAAANTTIYLVYLGNETFTASLSDVYNVTVYPLKTRLIVSEEPLTPIYSLTETRMSVRVERVDNSEPVANAVIYVYANGSYIGYGLTGGDGTLSIDIPGDITGLNLSEPYIDAAKIPSAGPLNITVVFNGTLGEIVYTNIGPVLLLREGSFDVVEGSTTTRVVDIVASPVTIKVFAGEGAAVEGSTIYTHATAPAKIRVAVMAGGHYIYNVDVELYLNNTLVDTEPIALGGGGAYAEFTVTAPNASYYTVRLRFPGSTGLAPLDAAAELYARWMTRTVFSRNAFMVLSVGENTVDVYMEATAYYYNYTSGLWSPLPGVRIDFYYNASIHYLGSNTTNTAGTASIIATVPRGIEGFTVEIPESTITDSSSDTVTLEQLHIPRDQYYALATPAPEPPVAAAIMLLAMVLLILRRRR